MTLTSSMTGIAPMTSLTPESVPAEKQLEMQELWEKTEKVLDRLPTKQKQAALAYFGEGLTREETGQSARS